MSLLSHEYKYTRGTVPAVYALELYLEIACYLFFLSADVVSILLCLSSGLFSANLSHFPYRVPCCQDAIQALNSLQSNASVLADKRNNYVARAPFIIGESVEYLKRIGYQVCFFHYELSMP